MAALIPSSNSESENVKIVFQQGDVFVHTAVPSSTLYDDIIRGTLSIIENAAGTFVEWRPSSGFTPVVEYEVHPVFSGAIEYGVVTTQEPKPMCKNTDVSENQHQIPYKIYFNVEEIQSIRRSDPRLAWSYVLFINKNESQQPALHFHNGGIQDMISSLQRYIWLTKSPVNDKVFIVKEKDDAMESALNQFELFTDRPKGAITKLFNNTFYDTLNSFSKVTNYVLGGMGGLDLQERRPQRNLDSEGDGDDFEFLLSEQPDLFGPVIPIARGNSLQPEEWCSYINDDGVIKDVDRLKERIFRGGIHDDIKCEAWKYLLGYYEFDLTYKEQSKRKAKKREDYLRMKLQWETISEEQETRFNEFYQRKQLVEKDANRTDRKVPFFEGENNENIQKLFNILMTYCMYNFDLGYVQGMSDLLAPILRLMKDEVDSFWCFVGFMEMEERMFEISQDLMKAQLETLGKLLKYLYPHFWEYLETHEAHNLYFCFRWILISFKREFGNGDVMTLWEALWTQQLSPHFKLFVCLAVLEREKDEMMKRKYDFNEILKHINKCSGNIDLQYALSRAESICLQLQKKDDLPDHIKVLINHPLEEDNKAQCLNNGDNNSHKDDNLNIDSSTNNMSGLSSSIDLVRTTDEAVVELLEDTHAVF